MEIRIDLSNYTPEQRRTLRRFLRELFLELDNKITKEGDERKPITLEDLGL